MINLDDFLSTSDDVFNGIAQEYYFGFKKEGNSTNDIKYELFMDKQYEKFIQILHDTYFFIKSNKSKPFACINKINNLSIQNKLNAEKKIHFIDAIIRIIVKNPGIERESMVLTLVQIANYRESLQPFFIDDADYQLHKFPFLLEDIKSNLETIKTPKEKYNYLKGLDFDYDSKCFQFNEIEKIYYEAAGIKNYLSVEMNRALFELQSNQNDDDITNPLIFPVELLNKVHAQFDGLLSKSVDISVFKSYFRKIATEIVLEEGIAMSAFCYFISKIEVKSIGISNFTEWMTYHIGNNNYVRLKKVLIVMENDASEKRDGFSLTMPQLKALEIKKKIDDKFNLILSD